MKMQDVKKIFFTAIVMIIVVATSIFSIGCDGQKRKIASLSQPQLDAYNEVVQYADTKKNDLATLSLPDLDAELDNLLGTLSMQADQSGIDREKQKAIYRIDILVLNYKQSLEERNSMAEMTAKMSGYEQKYRLYEKTDRYQGTMAQYQNEQYNYNQQKLTAVVNYQKKLTALGASNIISGQKETLKAQYEREYDEEYRQISNQEQVLETQWSNKQNYDTNLNLYNQTQTQLTNTLTEIANRYEKLRQEIFDKITKVV